MAEPFSANDVYYVNAQQNIMGDSNFCSATKPSSFCYDQDVSDISNCECKYKENVDKLNTISSTNGLTKEQNTDLNRGQALLVLNNISLGIGIFGMMWIIYANSE
jgi:hypothetical protein